MAPRSTTRSVSSSVPRALALLELVLAAETPPTSSGLAASVQIPQSTLTAMLASLRDLGYLHSDAGRYRPGPRLLALGQLAARHSTVADIRQALQLLVELTGETAYYSIHIDSSPTELGNVLPVEQVESPDEIRYVGILGHPTPVLHSSAGLVILAFSDPVPSVAADIQCDYGSGGPEDLRTVLARIRRDGIATLVGKDSRTTAGSAAAPLFQDGRLIGAMSISGPADRVRKLVPELPRSFAAAQRLLETPRVAAPDRQVLRWDSGARTFDGE